MDPPGNFSWNPWPPKGFWQKLQVPSPWIFILCASMNCHHIRMSIKSNKVYYIILTLSFSAICPSWSQSYKTGYANSKKMALPKQNVNPIKLLLVLKIKIGSRSLIKNFKKHISPFFLKFFVIFYSWKNI